MTDPAETLAAIIDPDAEVCHHDPHYSRSECGQCRGQEAWCAICSAPLCGCPIPPGGSDA